MKMVISPAKSLDYESNLPTDKSSNPCFLEEASKINELLREKSPLELSQLMKISDKLGNLNWERNQNFKTPFDKKMPDQLSTPLMVMFILVWTCTAFH